MTRIFLIHGYVEDPTMNEENAPLLPTAGYVLINLADEFLKRRQLLQQTIYPGCKAGTSYVKTTAIPAL